MKSKIMFALFVTVLASPLVYADERECGRPSEPVSEKEQVESTLEFKKIATSAGEWLRHLPRIQECGPALSHPGELLDAVTDLRVEFVNGPLYLCDEMAGTVRMVDAVNHPSGRVKVSKAGWSDATESERKLLVTHELAGVAGNPNEPWTTPICWVLNEGSPGRLIEIEASRFPRPILLADGGSSGGRGGGDVRTASLKLNAILAILDFRHFAELAECMDLEKALRAWILVPVESDHPDFDPVRVLWKTFPPMRELQPVILASLPPDHSYNPSTLDFLLLTLQILEREVPAKAVECVKSKVR